MLPVFYKGDDITIPIRLKRDGSYVDMNAEYANVIAAVYTDKNNPLIYGREVGSDYLLTVVDPTLYLIRIPSYISANLNTGVLTLEVKFLKTDNSLEDKYYDDIIRVELLTLKDSVIGTFTGLPRTIILNGDDYSQITNINITGVKSSISQLYWKIQDNYFYLFYDNDFNNLVAKTDKIVAPGTYVIKPVNNSGISGYVTFSFKYKLNWITYFAPAPGYIIAYALKNGITQTAIACSSNSDNDDVTIYAGTKTIGSIKQRVRARLYYELEPYIINGQTIKFYRNINDVNPMFFQTGASSGVNIKILTYPNAYIAGNIKMTFSSPINLPKNENNYLEIYDGNYQFYNPSPPAGFAFNQIFFKSEYINGNYMNIVNAINDNITGNQIIEVENTLKPAVVYGDTGGLIKSIQFSYINSNIAQGLVNDDGIINIV